MQDLRSAIIAAQHSTEAFKLAGDIDEPLDLSSERIGHLDARGARFRAPVNFRGARFEGIAWFDEARFEVKADFTGAVFDFDARFDAASFDQDALFIKAEFNGVAAFDKARFRSLCAFDGATSFGNFSIGEAQFAQSCSFRDVVCFGGLWCDRTEFSAPDFGALEVHGRSFMRGATVAGRNEREPLALALAGAWHPYGDVRTEVRGHRLD